MLLISDRIEHSASLARLLALWGPCVVVGLHDTPDARQSPRLVISDVDLSQRASVEALRNMLARCRNPATPYLCLLRAASARSLIQANALGASGALAADVPAPTLLDKIGQILRVAEGTADDDPTARTQHHFVSASAAVAELLTAAGRGGALPIAALDRSIDAINDAADDHDIGGWLEIVWNHDDLTYQHCLLVAGLAAAFARHLGFPKEARKLLTSAAVLHDIGKSRIPLDILHKAGRLTPDEMAIMRTHPQIGHDMLSRQGGFAKAIVEVAHRHHEYLDGTGNPQGLRGGAISDVVRMITICDIYAALIERRPYKAPAPPESAYATLLDMDGKLDKDLVRAFKAVVLADEPDVARAACA